MFDPNVSRWRRIQVRRDQPSNLQHSAMVNAFFMFRSIVTKCLWRQVPNRIFRNLLRRIDFRPARREGQNGTIGVEGTISTTISPWNHAGAISA